MEDRQPRLWMLEFLLLVVLDDAFPGIVTRTAAGLLISSPAQTT